MAVCKLGPLSWRIDPTEINFGTQLDIARQETVGGQVIQVLGSTTTDITITGLFGTAREGKVDSWQLAEGFHKAVQGLMDRQIQKAAGPDLRPKGTTNWSQGTISAHLGSNAPVQAPLEFSYLDGRHDWRFQVLVKALTDADGNGSLEHRTGKFSYGYVLTLFVVKAFSDEIAMQATDRYLSRIANGFGWSRSVFNGPLTTDDAVAYIQQNGGSVGGFLGGILTGTELGQNLPGAQTPPGRPGGTTTGEGRIGGQSGRDQEGS